MRREAYARRVIAALCSQAPIERNAGLVVGTNIINADYKFIKVLDEAYKSFLLGLYHSTVSLCSITAERLCYDILEKSKIKIDDIELDDKQKKAIFKIPYSTLVELVKSTNLISLQTASNMMKVNEIRQSYIHPTLGRDAYKDAKDSINLLCQIIDSSLDDYVRRGHRRKL